MPTPIQRMLSERRAKEAETPISVDDARAVIDSDEYITDLSPVQRMLAERPLYEAKKTAETLLEDYRTGNGVKAQTQPDTVTGAAKESNVSPETGLPDWIPQDQVVSGMSDTGVVRQSPPKGTKDAFREMKEDPMRFMPYLKDAKQVQEVATVASAVKRLQDGNASQDDLINLQDYIERQDMDARTEKTFWYGVADGLSRMPAFMGEMATSWGVYTGGKNLAMKGMNKVAPKVVEKMLKNKLGTLGIKSVAGIAGATLQAPIVGALRVPADFMERTLPDFEISADDKKMLQGVITNEGEDTLTAMKNAFGDNWVEVVSEHSGAAFSGVAAPAKKAILNVAAKNGVIRSIMKLNPGKSPAKIVDAIQKTGWNGFIEEMLEERAGEVGRAALGINEYKLPSKEQLLTEMAMFSVPGVAASIAQNMGGSSSDNNNTGPGSPTNPLPGSPTDMASQPFTPTGPNAILPQTNRLTFSANPVVREGQANIVKLREKREEMKRLVAEEEKKKAQEKEQKKAQEVSPVLSPEKPAETTVQPEAAEKDVAPVVAPVIEKPKDVSDAVAEFVYNRVTTELRSIEKVKASYNSDSAVDRYANEIAEQMYGKEEETAAPVTEKAPQVANDRVKTGDQGKEAVKTPVAEKKAVKPAKETLDDIIPKVADATSEGAITEKQPWEMTRGNYYQNIRKTEGNAKSNKRDNPSWASLKEDTGINFKVINDKEVQPDTKQRLSGGFSEEEENKLRQSLEEQGYTVDKIRVRNSQEEDIPIGGGWRVKTPDHYPTTPEHYRAVKQALADNKPVPAEVIKEYPDLVKQPKAKKAKAVKSEETKSPVDIIDKAASQLDEMKQASKERSMRYQPDDKDLVADYLTAQGTPTKTTDLDLPFKEWAAIREENYDKAVEWSRAQKEENEKPVVKEPEPEPEPVTTKTETPVVEKPVAKTEQGFQFDTDLDDLTNKQYGKPWNQLKKKERTDAIKNFNDGKNPLTTPFKKQFILPASEENYKVIVPNTYENIPERLSMINPKMGRYFTNGNYLFDDKAVANELREKYFKIHPDHLTTAKESRPPNVEQVIPKLDNKTEAFEQAILVGEKEFYPATMYSDGEAQLAFNSGFVKLIKKYFPKAVPHFVPLYEDKELANKPENKYHKRLVFMQNGKLKALIMPLRDVKSNVPVDYNVPGAGQVKPAEVKPEPTKQEDNTQSLINKSWESPDGKRTVVGKAENRPDGWLEVSTEGMKHRVYIHESDLQAEIDRDTANKKYRDEIAKQQAEEDTKKAERKSKEEDVKGFADDMTPMQKGRVVKSLNKMVMIKDKAQTIKKHIEAMVEAGGVDLQTREENKVKPMTRTRFNRASNREQAAHEKKMKDAGTKTVYNVNNYDLGKTAYDYAQYLIGKQNTAKPDIQSGVQAPESNVPQNDNDGVLVVARDIVYSDVSAARKTQAMRKLAKDFNLSGKEAEEATETALVQIADEIASNPVDTPEDIYAKLQSLYETQPLFNKRTSGSIERQAYSTPAPLAFLANHMIDTASGNAVYEPTAGNGLLLIGVPKDKVTANELDVARADNLKKVGFKNVTSNDATNYIPNKKQDRIVMNPPFGGIDNVKYDGYGFKRLDHLIAVKALESLDDNGQAVIITGANMKKPGAVSGADKVFMNYLYNNYNVADNFSIDGELYRRQGASFPIRMTVINGRKAEPTFEHLAPESVDNLDNYDILYNRAQEVRDEIEKGRKSVESDRRPGLHSGTTGAVEAAPGNTGEIPVSPKTTVQSDSGRSGTGRTGERSESDRPSTARTDSGHNEPSPNTSEIHNRSDAASDTGRGNKTGGMEEGRRGSDEKQKELQVSDAGKRDGGLSKKSHTESVPTQDVRLKPAPRRISESQMEYVPESSLNSLHTVIPEHLSAPVRKSLEKIASGAGTNIDQYVMDKLGYASVEAMNKALAAEQIDGSALIISNIDKKSQCIVGDETGVGKGRQAAAAIRYAKSKGYLPIFFTADPKLFSDINRDMTNTNTVFNPFIIGSANKSHIIDTDTEKIIKRALPNPRQKIIMQTRELPEEYDSILVTYSQITTQNVQQKFIDALSKTRPITVIFDESHLASGEESMTGAFLHGGELTIGKGSDKVKVRLPGVMNAREVNGVVCLSATYAKRPESMVMYSRTDLGKALESPSQLISVMKTGGVPLQEITAAALAENGQYIRRELDFTDVDFKTSVIEPEDVTTLMSNYDDTAEILREIVEYSRIVKGAVDGGRVTFQSDSSLAVNEFSSVVHTKISQLLLGLRSDAAVEKAIEAHKKGRKPVITLINTNGSFLSELATDNDLHDGDDITDSSFGMVLQRSLDRTMRVSEDLPSGDTVIHQMTPEELGLEDAYRDVVALISEYDADIPLSPIDYITGKLEAAGIKMSELTARQDAIEYTSSGKAIYRKRKVPNKNKVVNDFNSGVNDGILLNASGSTGLSLHASKEFKDQRPREMIIIQPDLDIATLMQKIGRIKRTGMVEGGAFYDMPILPIEAERRPASVLASKLKSLNANVSARAGSGVTIDAMDMFNKYGDRLVAEMLADDPDLAYMVDMSVSVKDDGTIGGVPPDYARKFTGRMALLPNNRQKEIYDYLIPAYKEYISYLKETGAYDLETQEHSDWDAIQEESNVLHPGKGGKSIFTAPIVLNKYSLHDTRKPPSYDEVKKLTTSNFGESRRSAIDVIDKLKQTANDNLETYIQRKREISKADATVLEKYEARVREKWETTTQALDNIVRDRLGTIISVNTDEDAGSYNGVITNIEYKLPKGGDINPVRPSNFIVDIAINHPVGRLKIPFSMLMSGSVSIGNTDGYVSAEEWDTLQSSEHRISRYIMTGNLVGAYVHAGRGKIVRFKTHEGEDVTGILMPMNWKETDIIADPRLQFHSPDAVLDYLEENSWMREKLKTQGEVEVAGSYGRYTLSVPKAKNRGGKFFLDKGLRRITGDFESRGNRMTVFLNKDQAQNAIKYVMRMGERFIGPRDNADRIQQINEKYSGKGKRNTTDKYSSSKTTPHESGITRADVEKIFPNTKVGQDSEKNFWVEKDGHRVKIYNVSEIKPNEYAFEVGYQRKRGSGEKITGVYRKGEISISRHGDTWTLAHEGYHWLEDVGFITKADQNALNKRIADINGKDISKVNYEDRAKYVEDNLSNRNAERVSSVQRVLQKIADWMDGLVNLFVRTSRGVIRDVETGKIMDRNKPVTGIVDNAARYQVEAWHGSPHGFDRFAMDKIGSGEGAQAFGFGLYFTGLKDIAKNYAENIFGNTMTHNNKPIKEYKHSNVVNNIVQAQHIIDNKSFLSQVNHLLNRDRDYLKTNGDYLDPKVVKLYERTIAQYRDIKKDIVDGKFKFNYGRNLYKVTLHKGKKPGEYTWLDWDKPVSEKLFGKIEDALKKENMPVHEILRINRIKNGRNVGTGYITKDFRNQHEKEGSSLVYPTGHKIYYELSQQLRNVGVESLRKRGIIGQEALLMSDNQVFNKAASLFLLKNGIDGIRYPSGTLSGVKDSQSSNYVVFDENAVTIEEHEKYSTKQTDPEPASQNERLAREIARLKGTITPGEKNKLEKHRKETIIKYKINAYKKGFVAGASEKAKELKALKQLISDYARKHLPVSNIRRTDINQVLTRIANAQTIRDVEEAYRKVEHVQEHTDRTLLREKIDKIVKTHQPKSVNRRPEGSTMTADEYKLMGEIQVIMNMNGETMSDAHNSLMKRIADEDREPNEDEQEFLSRLEEFGDYKNSNVAELTAMLEDLELIVKYGRSKRQMKEDVLKADRDMARSDVIKVTTGGKGILSAVATRNKGLDKEESWFDKWMNYNYHLEFLLDKISKYDKKSDPLDSAINRRFTPLIQNARNAETAGVREYHNLVHDKLVEIYGIEKGGKLEKRLEENIVRQDTGIMIDDDELKLSQNEAYKMWQIWQDTASHETLDLMGYNEDVMRQIEAWLTPEVKAWAEWQMNEFYPQYYPTINEVYRERYNIDLPFNPFYSPWFRDVQGDTLDDQMLNNKDMFASLTNGHMKSRVANTEPFRIVDGDRVLSQHIVMMEHFKAWAEPIRMLRGVFNNGDVKKAIRQYHGSSANTIIENRIDDIARGGVSPKLANHTLDTLRRKFTAAVIGLNPVVFLKQMASHPAYASEVPFFDYLKGSADFWVHPIKNYKTLMQSEVMKDRGKQGHERDIKLLMARTTPQRFAGAKTVPDVMMTPTRVGDRLAIITGGWSVYKYHYDRMIEAGRSKETANRVAIEKFEQSTSRTQQSASTEHQGDIMQMGSAMKLFTMFQTSQNSYFNMEAMALRNLMHGRGDAKDNIKRFVLYHFVLPTLFQLIASGGRWDDDRQLRALMLGSLNGLLAIGNGVETAVDAALGNYPWKQDSEPVMSSLFKAKDVMYAVQKVFNEGIDDIAMSDVMKAIDELASWSSKLAGIPYDPVKRNVEGVKDFATGEDRRPQRLLGYSPYSLDTSSRLFPEKEEPGIRTLKAVPARKQKELNRERKEVNRKESILEKLSK